MSLYVPIFEQHEIQQEPGSVVQSSWEHHVKHVGWEAIIALGVSG